MIKVRTEIEAPFISVVIAVFNGASTLTRCIDSVASQAYRQLELIIIDGGSTDGTVDILKANTDKIAYWKSEPDRGIYHAWNKALDHVRGEWIFFLGADDFFWSPDALEQIVPHLVEAYPDCRVVYGQVAKVRTDGSLLYAIGQPWGKTRRSLRYRMSVPHQATFHHRGLFEGHGKFDESFRIAGDYDLLMRELRSHDAYFMDGLIVAGMQHGGVSNQPESTRLYIRELCRSRRKNDIGGFSGRIAWQWCRAWIRVGVSRCIGKELAGVVADLYRVSSGKPRLWTRLKRKKH